MTGGVDGRAAYPEVAADLLPWLSVAQMAEADRLAIDVFDATLTPALPKTALRGVDPLYLADLGLPPALWNTMGIDVAPLFGAGRILRILP